MSVQRRLVELVRKEGASGVGDWRDEAGTHYFLTEHCGMTYTYEVGDIMSIRWKYFSTFGRNAWKLEPPPEGAVFTRVTRKRASCTKINENTQVWKTEDGMTIILNTEYNGLTAAKKDDVADLVLKSCEKSLTGINWFAEALGASV